MFTSYREEGNNPKGIRQPSPPAVQEETLPLCYPVAGDTPWSPFLLCISDSELQVTPMFTVKGHLIPNHCCCFNSQFHSQLYHRSLIHSDSSISSFVSQPSAPSFLFLSPLVSPKFELHSGGSKDRSSCWKPVPIQGKSRRACGSRTIIDCLFLPSQLIRV